MTAEQQMIAPEGFERFPDGIGFADSLQPLYSRQRKGDVRFGLFILPQHCNTMNFCHGGVLMTLADMAGSAGVHMARGAFSASPTINLSLDFISAACPGEWIEAVAESATPKRRFGFCSGTIYGPEKIVARFNGTFYHPEHEGMTPADNAAMARIADFTDRG